MGEEEGGDGGMKEEEGGDDSMDDGWRDWESW